MSSDFPPGYDATSWVLLDGHNRVVTFFAASENPTVPTGQTLVQAATLPDNWRGNLSPAVPASITAAQLRYYLNQAGLRSQFDALVAAADQDTKDAVEFEINVRRDNPRTVSLGHALGLTDDQIDDAFRAAAQL